jgi:hypothetical protein
VKALCLVVLSGTLALSSGCSFKDSLKTANQSVVNFHTDFNAQRFDDILANASQEFQRAGTAEQSRRFFSTVRRKLGEAGQWSVASWRVNVTPSGSIVNIRCKTKFARGDGDESFVWRIVGKDASLINYHIDSQALVLDQ